MNRPWVYIGSKAEEAFLPSRGKVLEWPQNTKICPTSSVTESHKFIGVNRVACKNNNSIYVITQPFHCYHNTYFKYCQISVLHDNLFLRNWVAILYKCSLPFVYGCISWVWDAIVKRYSLSFIFHFFFQFTLPTIFKIFEMPSVSYLLVQYSHKKTILPYFILDSTEDFWFSWIWCQRYLKSVTWKGVIKVV